MDCGTTVHEFAVAVVGAFVWMIVCAAISDRRAARESAHGS
jgi:hypothetical protein